jgi:hypothetical protein
MTKKITPSQPYQPFVLRVFHGLTGLCLLGAMVTAYWTYDTYDRRWGGLSLPIFRPIEGIHGTLGLWTLMIFPAFLVYACHRGQRRLLQPDSWRKLTEVGKPIWWYTCNRLINVVALLALTFALFSGKKMGETWLPKGELDHGWYYAHLISWVVMAVVVALHVLVSARVGGLPLLLSMFSWQVRDKDSPALWPAHLAEGWSVIQRGAWIRWFQPFTTTIAMELSILVILALGWL